MFFTEKGQISTEQKFPFRTNHWRKRGDFAKKN